MIVLIVAIVALVVIFTYSTRTKKSIKSDVTGAFDRLDETLEGKIAFEKIRAKEIDEVRTRIDEVDPKIDVARDTMGAQIETVAKRIGGVQKKNVVNAKRIAAVNADVDKRLKYADLEAGVDSIKLGELSVGAGEHVLGAKNWGLNIAGGGVKTGKTRVSGLLAAGSLRVGGDTVLGPTNILHGPTEIQGRLGMGRSTFGGDKNRIHGSTEILGDVHHAGDMKFQGGSGWGYGLKHYKGPDFEIKDVERAGGRAGPRRALVHGAGDRLIMNNAGDYTGGVAVNSKMDVRGNFSTQGDFIVGGNWVVHAPPEESSLHIAPKSEQSWGWDKQVHLDNSGRVTVGQLCVKNLCLTEARLAEVLARVKALEEAEQTFVEEEGQAAAAPAVLPALTATYQTYNNAAYRNTLMPTFANMTDGNPATSWGSSGTSGDIWIRMDLGIARYVNYAKVGAGTAEQWGDGNKYIIEPSVLQSSMDGVTWRNVVSLTSSNMKPASSKSPTDFPVGASVRFLRILRPNLWLMVGVFSAH